LTAIIGPNGAGKTTLMRALCGERPDTGTVCIDGEDLYASPQHWLQKIGYVPAHNVLHEHLTVREALIYVGRLRLPGAPLGQVVSRVDQLLGQFFGDINERLGETAGGSADQAASDDRLNRPLRLLSDGERKRANICAELITRPPLLLLDEPTSGLDPDAERYIMHLLADYAHGAQQTTVLVITHTLNTIDVCDEVLFIENGHLRADGATQDVLSNLEKQIPNAQPDEPAFYRWARVFASFRTHPADRKLRSEMALAAPIPGIVHRVHPTSAAPWGYQLRCLLSRYLRVRLGDPWSFIGTLLAGLSGVLLFILPMHTFMKPVDESEVALALNQARQSVYVVSLIVTLIGLITSYTEISKEYRIYRHERLKGLSPSAYFASKWIWLTGAVGILAPIFLMLFIVLIWRQPLFGFPEPRINEVVGWWDGLTRFQLVGLFTARSSWLILSVLITACITSVTLGLFISALAGDSDKGYLYLSFVVVFIVLFSGLIRNEKLQQLVDSLSFLSTGRWAYEGFASSVGLYCWLDSWRFEEFNSTGHLLSVYLSLGSLTLGAAFLAVVVLRLRDPWSRLEANLRQLLLKDWRPTILYLAVLAVLVSYTVFLRQQSYQYHALNYWSRQEYGGSNAYEYAKIRKVSDPTPLQYWNGRISQSWCGE
jgi:ABC-type multidrug transport system ATPase subunit